MFNNLQKKIILLFNSNLNNYLFSIISINLFLIKFEITINQVRKKHCTLLVSLTPFVKVWRKEEAVFMGMAMDEMSLSK